MIFIRNGSKMSIQGLNCVFGIDLEMHALFCLLVIIAGLMVIS
jgi:hypothetical protein